MIEEKGLDVLPCVCVDKKLYKIGRLLNADELSNLTGSAISYQEIPNDAE